MEYSRREFGRLALAGVPATAWWLKSGSTLGPTHLRPGPSHSRTVAPSHRTSSHLDALSVAQGANPLAECQRAISNLSIASHAGQPRLPVTIDAVWRLSRSPNSAGGRYEPRSSCQRTR